MKRVKCFWSGCKKYGTWTYGNYDNTGIIPYACDSHIIKAKEQYKNFNCHIIFTNLKTGKTEIIDNRKPAQKISAKELS